MSEIEENVVWKGKSNQLINFWPLVISLVLATALISGGIWGNAWIALGALIPLVYAGWIWLQTKCRVYELTNERMRVYEGVFNQEINEVELYRVKDTKILRPFWLRLFGLANVVLETSDRNLGTFELEAVRDGMNLREQIRKYVERLRDKKRVREVDFEGGGDEFDTDMEMM